MALSTDQNPEIRVVASVPGGTRRRFLGQMLVAQGIISSAQLDEVLERQRTASARIGRLLIDLGYVTEAQVAGVVATQMRLPVVDLSGLIVPTPILQRVPRELAVRHHCLPLKLEGRVLHLATADPTDLAAIDAIRFATGLRIQPVVAAESDLEAAIGRHYPTEDPAFQLGLGRTDLAEQITLVSDVEIDEGDTIEEELERAAHAAPVIALVNAILADAIDQGASDIHIEPQSKGVNLRYRVDGTLRPVITMPIRSHAKVVSRIKITAHMDIAERRQPQDGRARLVFGSRAFDLRVSTLPTADGEKVVIRVLDQSRASMALEDLGFSDEVLAQFGDLLRQPQGLILVCGPTGSGKTSTLYAGLNRLADDTVNIVTVEDPIEYRLEGVNQVAVSERAGLSFATGLRSILRQDPDVIMVGEIRDLETAQIAFRAAQTGHLVLSTLHTNDAASAVTRLVDMGIPNYLVAASVIAVQSQRLVRRLCECRTIQADGTGVPVGCPRCHATGYRGRLAVHELLRFTPAVREAVARRASTDRLREMARGDGMRSLYEDGLARIACGLTTMDELLREVAPPEDASALGPHAHEPMGDDSRTTRGRRGWTGRSGPSAEAGQETRTAAGGERRHRVRSRR